MPKFTPSQKQEIKMLCEMIDLQAEIDQYIFKKHGLEGYHDIFSHMDFALIDEIGELNHELKPQWCWWKKPQPINRAKVLEELVDVVHFVLMDAICRIRCNDLVADFVSVIGIDDPEKAKGWSVLDFLPEHSQPGKALRLVPLSLGFTWPEVYEAYKKKNAVNRERAENGY